MQTIKAIFENGVIHPIHHLEIEEGKRIRVTIEEVEEKG
jgi:predicted DNA-binding antitoxin AbrB/MazE fold protein